MTLPLSRRVNGVIGKVALNCATIQDMVESVAFRFTSKGACAGAIDLDATER
ncbi:MAG: hypothetical protein LDL33_04340 [Desulfomonile sp.]|nr:hypothetical protein [Desulfomonile sp.]